MDPLAGVRVDKTSPIPLYHQVATGIEEAIRSEALPVGSFLPNEIDLAARFGLSRPTMRQAISELAKAGLVQRQRGVGTRVTRPKLARKAGLSSLYEYLQSEGAEPSTEVLSLERVAPPPGLADLFPGDQPLWDLRRLRSTRDGPLAVMRNWLPGHLELTAEALVADGLYSVLRGQGVRFVTAFQRIGATGATAEVAGRLGVKPGTPCLTLHREAHDQDGRLGDVGDHVYRADRYTIESEVATD
ncbi:MAG: GntR family transcriptional regulator [Propionibacteriaceae bacterium]|jgi:DNA-binding GntR family transcriptional regulator|nr:GntR family transcriptional regulator [Propionibacteriaceae bacterium]